MNVERLGEMIEKFREMRDTDHSVAAKTDHSRQIGEMPREKRGSDADFNRRVDACVECHMGDNYAELCSVHAKEAGWENLNVYGVNYSYPTF